MLCLSNTVGTGFKFTFHIQSNPPVVDWRRENIFKPDTRLPPIRTFSVSLGNCNAFWCGCFHALWWRKLYMSGFSPNEFSIKLNLVNNLPSLSNSIFSLTYHFYLTSFSSHYNITLPIHPHNDEHCLSWISTTTATTHTHCLPSWNYWTWKDFQFQNHHHQPTPITFHQVTTWSAWGFHGRFNRIPGIFSWEAFYKRYQNLWLLTHLTHGN